MGVLCLCWLVFGCLCLWLFVVLYISGGLDFLSCWFIVIILVLVVIGLIGLLLRFLVFVLCLGSWYVVCGEWLEFRLLIAVFRVYLCCLDIL